MEGLLHPVGPEDVRTYWIRRGGAIAVLLVLMIGLGLIISNLGDTEGKATPTETTAVPAPPVGAAVPAETEAPPPPPVPSGNGAPNEVTDEEAVPVPSSARRAATAPDPAGQASERASDDADDSQADSKPDPEPANTFHLNEVEPSPNG